MKWKEYLDMLENHGYEAYVIGGYTRDKLLGIDSYDIDIATSAKPDDIQSIFNIETSAYHYGSIYFQDGEYSIDITTFRNDITYKNRRPIIKFISTLEEDIIRRDFTINSIAMDSKGKYIDYLNGIDDLKNKVIRSIGDPDTKFQEDPLRMLRAIRFATIYKFNIETNTLNSIIKNKELIKTLSSDRIKEELSLILTNKNALEGIELLEKLKIFQMIGIEHPSNYQPTNNIEGAWAQLNFDTRYNFSKKEFITIKNLKEILSKGQITQEDIFNFSLDTVLIAGSILQIKESDIKKIYKAMPIHNESDLALNGKKIIDLLGDQKNIKSIKQDLINNILSGNLSNEINTLKEYIIEKWK